MNRPDALADLGSFEVVHCYGLLYHLEQAAAAIRAMAHACTGLLVLETCVAPGRDERIDNAAENAGEATQSVAGQGNRPTRAWVLATLKREFGFAYQTRTQPDHPEFPRNWSRPAPDGTLQRAVFVAGRTPLHLASLSEAILERQARL
jgi:hypothetical protein